MKLGRIVAARAIVLIGLTGSPGLGRIIGRLWSKGLVQWMVEEISKFVLVWMLTGLCEVLEIGQLCSSTGMESDSTYLSTLIEHIVHVLDALCFSVDFGFGMER